MLQASAEGTSTKHSLQSSGGGSSGTCTNPPVLVSREYREVEANVSKLEHREHTREFEPSGETRNLLMGWMGSRLLLEAEERRMPVRASTVSHFRRLARLLAGRTRLELLPFRRTKGTEFSAAAPLFLLRFTRDLRPGMARKLRARLDGGGASAGAAAAEAGEGAWGTGRGLVRRRPLGSRRLALSATLVPSSSSVRVP